MQFSLCFRCVPLELQEDGREKKKKGNKKKREEMLILYYCVKFAKIIKKNKENIYRDLRKELHCGGRESRYWVYSRIKGKKENKKLKKYRRERKVLIIFLFLGILIKFYF